MAVMKKVKGLRWHKKQLWHGRRVYKGHTIESYFKFPNTTAGQAAARREWKIYVAKEISRIENSTEEWEFIKDKRKLQRFAELSGDEKEVKNTSNQIKQLKKTSGETQDLAITEQLYNEFPYAAYGETESIQERQIDILDHHDMFAGNTTPDISQLLSTNIELFGKKKIAEVGSKEYVSLMKRLGYFQTWIEDNSIGDDVTKIASSHLDGYRTHLTNLQKLEKKDNGIANTTAIKRMRTVKEFFNFICLNDVIVQLPKRMAIERGLTINDVTEYEAKPYSTDELKAMWDNLKTDQDRLFMMLGLQCGHLPSDLADLKKSEVDLKTGYITRRRSKIKKSQGKDGILVSYKIWDTTRELLKRCKSNHKELYLLDGGLPVMIRYDHTQPHGKKQRNTVEPVFRRLLINLGIDDMSFGNLRHTGASKLCEHEIWGNYDDVYLSHKESTVAKKHYSAFASAPFTKAMLWLETQFPFLIL